ncbi:MAG: NFACT RNA binding domain-containing protein [Candidatus Cloacimonetes bacterium]|nr:NFACT RNA binding domain-containing protein [Candidatus Cloacimonadota bacterium]
MEFKYLAQWAREQKRLGLFFRTVLRWRDQYALVFNQGSFLQINLQSQQPFCFFSDLEIINWQPAVELAIMEKHLQRTRLQEIGIMPGERIIYLDFTKPDPFLPAQQFRLFLEFIPQFTNIILTRNENDNWKIVDCSRKVTLAENHFRQLIPAVSYELPPAGFSNTNEPVIYPLSFDERLHILENAPGGFSGMDEFLESFYYQGWLLKISEQTRNSSLKRLKAEIRKKERKLEKLAAELASAEAGNAWKQQGELLKANQHLIKNGIDRIRLIDYFLPQMPEIEIKLKPDKSPAANVADYFRKYRKSVTGKIIIARQQEITEKEIATLKQQIAELEELNLPLPGEYSLPQTAKTPLMDTLTRIIVNQDWEFFIGRNSKDNDFITTRLGRPDDWWFHTRIYKGTHVLLRNLKKKVLPDDLLQLGCRLAAAYSKAAKSSNVPVDYTQIRYVRKPRGSAPGFVVYTNQKTLYVDPLDLRAARKIITEKYAESTG